jgi:hypothetical protein
MDLTPTRPHKNRKIWAKRLRARKAIPDKVKEEAVSCGGGR